MAEILLVMLLLGGGAAVIAEQNKKRKMTPSVSRDNLKKIKKFLKKSKFFKEADAGKIVSIINKRINGEKDKEEQKKKKTFQEITGMNTQIVPPTVPQAWCPNDKRTTCSLYDKDQHFPKNCIGDVNKQQCLNRIKTFVASDNNHKSQIENYCKRINDVCVTYKNKQYARKMDRELCGNLIPGCN
jgi:hypothetical protein